MDQITSKNITIYRFTSLEVGTNMYVLLCKDCALVVDPHPSQEVFFLLNKFRVRKCLILLTHEHPDHTWGIYDIQQNFSTELICQEECAVAIADYNNNDPSYVIAMLAVQDSRNGTNNAISFREKYVTRIYKADLFFKKNYTLFWQNLKLSFFSTPGHSKGSCSCVVNDNIIFTGDSLLYDYPVLTRIPGGSLKQYKDISLPFFCSIKENILALPGHGREFYIYEIVKGRSYVGSFKV